MKSLLRTTVLTLALLAALAAPAAAGFQFGTCGLFEAIAEDSIAFENSANFTDVKGDAFVRDPVNGFIKTGQKNKFGALFAHRIIMQSGSTANFCFADIIEGNLAGCLVTGAFVEPPGCSGPFPPGIVTPNMPVACVPGTPVVLAGVQFLAPGCYSSIRFLADANITLDAGAFYFSQTSVQMGNRVTLQSDVSGTKATIVSKGQTITGVQNHWFDIFAFQLASSPAMQIFNESILTRSVALAPNGVLHFHNKSKLEDSAIAANVLDVEPIVTTQSDTPPVVCECPPGYKFRLETCTTVSCSAARECVPAL